MGTVTLLVYAGYLSGHGIAYYVLSCCGALAHFVWQLSSWELNSEKSSGKLFKVHIHFISSQSNIHQYSQSNGDLGLIIFGGMVVDYALKGTSFALVSAS